MRTFTTCMQCEVETGVPNFGSMGVERIPDDGVIEITCDRGHHTFTIIQQVKYEILSELAVTALMDGYYRESVASFASALERLYEYYVDVVCRARKIDQAAFTTAWKPLHKSSERQLGAFTMIHLLETGKAFSLLNDRHISFRNNVIHAGLIPNRKEAILYGQAVGECAAPLIELIQSPPYQETRQTLIFEAIHKKSQRAIKAGAHQSTQSMATPFGFSDPATKFDLQAILGQRAKRPDMDRSVAEAHALARLIADTALLNSP